MSARWILLALVTGLCACTTASFFEKGEQEWITLSDGKLSPDLRGDTVPCDDDGHPRLLEVSGKYRVNVPLDRFLSHKMILQVFEGGMYQGQLPDQPLAFSQTEGTYTLSGVQFCAYEPSRAYATFRQFYVESTILDAESGKEIADRSSNFVRAGAICIPCQE